MKKSKIFLTTATLVLAVTAIFATKAHKKFAAVSSAKTTAGASVNFIFKSDLSNLMTTANTGDLLKIKVAGQTLPLVTVTNENPVYLR